MVVMRRARSAAGVDVWVAVLVALALVVSLGIAAVADGERPAAGLEPQDECDDAPVVQAAKTAGFRCTKLYNKGRPSQVLGRLFVRLHEGLVTVAIDTGSNADVSDLKLCIDDEDDPLASRVSCLGSTAGETVSAPYTIGDRVRLAGPPEEDPGNYEYQLVEGALPLTSGGTTFGGSTFVTYTARVGLTTGPSYGHFSFHFNQSRRSIEAFFDLTPPASVTLRCDENTTFEGDGEPTFTVRPEGEPGCEKEVFFDAGARIVLDATQYVNLSPVVTGGTKLLFLEEIEWLKVPAGTPPRALYYDDDNDGNDEPALMPTCLQDPRPLDGNGIPLFDIRDDVSVANAGTVLPTGHTSCLVETSLTVAGGQVFTRHIVFNVGDGLRFH